MMLTTVFLVAAGVARTRGPADPVTRRLRLGCELAAVAAALGGVGVVMADHRQSATGARSLTPPAPRGSAAPR
jgi:hypothetical protein